MKVKQSGFTLIELVVVITILGILAAIALPRFANLQTQARMAKMNGAAGAMKSASALSHATQLTNNLAPGANVVMEGATIGMINGYPIASRIGLAAGITAGLPSSDYFQVGGIGGGGDNSGSGTITYAPDAGHTTCTIIYTEAGVLGLYNVDPTNVTAANCA